MELYFILYSSVPTQQLSDAELEHLLQISREQNAQHGITGMLLCLRDMYLQFIEGPEEPVRRLYENIQQDNRHFNINTLNQGILKDRHFPNWSMGLELSNVTFNDYKGCFDSLGPESLQLIELMDPN